MQVEKTDKTFTLSVRKFSDLQNVDPYEQCALFIRDYYS